MCTKRERERERDEERMKQEERSRRGRAWDEERKVGEKNRGVL